MESLLRPSEVARLLKVHTETTYHRIKTGELPGSQAGEESEAGAEIIKGQAIRYSYCGSDLIDYEERGE